MKQIVTLLFFALAILSSCKKTDLKNEEPDWQPVTRPIGTSTGAIKKQVIGTGGGTIKTTDNSISIYIPAGALSANTEIGIEPITNTNIAGIGKAFRLTPHGTKFAKPVEITVDYKKYVDSISLEPALGLSFQDSAGVWRFIGINKIDTGANKLTARTNHFSDWAIMSFLTLYPHTASANENDIIELQARDYLDASDELLIPMYDTDFENGYPVGNYRLLNPGVIKQWTLAGPGSLKSNENKATYTAPSTIDKPQTVAVNCQVKIGQGGSYHLVSNIRLLGDEPHIYYLEVNEDTDELFIHGTGFGAQGQGSEVMINTYKLEGDFTIMVWSDALIRCKIPGIGPNASGPVRVINGGRTSEPRILNEWTVLFKYYFVQGRVSESLHEEAILIVKLRGDGQEPEKTVPRLVDESSGHISSHVLWAGAGVATNSFSLESCGTLNIRWDSTHGDQPIIQKKNFSHTLKDYFKVDAERLSKEFSIEMGFQVTEKIPQTKTLTPCSGPASTWKTNASISVIDFGGPRIHLKLSNNNILAGKVTEWQSPDCGMVWDVTDGHLFFREVEMKWEMAPGKWQ